MKTSSQVSSKFQQLAGGDKERKPLKETGKSDTWKISSHVVGSFMERVRKPKMWGGGEPKC